MGLNLEWKRKDSHDLLKLRNEWVKKLPEDKRREVNALLNSHFDEESSDVLKLENLKGASVILIGGLVIACIFFLLEHIVGLRIVVGYFES